MRQLKPILGVGRVWHDVLGRNPDFVNLRAVGREPLSDGDAGGGAVAQALDALHGAFPEAFLAQQNGASTVAKGACDDL